MEEVLKQVRKENLLLLLQGFAREKEFASRVGLEPSYLSRIKGGQPIGGKVARQIEHAMGKPYLWLDTPPEKHSEIEAVGATEHVLRQTAARYPANSLLLDLIKVIEALSEEKQRALLEFLR